MKTQIALILSPLLLIAVGCAKPPAEKMTAAEKAVAEARDAGAAQYMGEDFTKLENMLNGAKGEMTAQDTKFALLRDYGKVEQGLTTVQAEAVRIVAETGKKKEEAKSAAVQAQQAAQAAVKTSMDLLEQAPVGKDRAAVEAIKADAEGLNNSLPELQTAIDKADYQGAQAKAKAIQEKAQALATEIQTAIEKIQAAKAPKGKSKK